MCYKSCWNSANAVGGGSLKSANYKVPNSGAAIAPQPVGCQ